MKMTIDGLDVRYADVGPHDAETLLFLHGFPFDHTMWDQQLIFFPQRYRCIAPDLRGHGGTAFDGAKTIDRMADDVLALLDALRLPRVTLCGMSMGGYIAFALWRKAAGRFARLVLVDTKATPDSPEARANRLKLAEEVLERGSAHAAAVQMPKLFAPQHLGSPAAAKIRRQIEGTSRESIASTLAALAERADSTATLAAVHVPALIIVGAQDVLTPIADADYMRDRIAGSSRVIIQDAGHMAPLENPGDFNLALDTFLERG